MYRNCDVLLVLDVGSLFFLSRCDCVVVDVADETLDVFRTDCDSDLEDDLLLESDPDLDGALLKDDSLLVDDSAAESGFVVEDGLLVVDEGAGAGEETVTVEVSFSVVAGTVRRPAVTLSEDTVKLLSVTLKSSLSGVGLIVVVLRSVTVDVVVVVDFAVGSVALEEGVVAARFLVALAFAFDVVRYLRVLDVTESGTVAGVVESTVDGVRAVAFVVRVVREGRGEGVTGAAVVIFENMLAVDVPVVDRLAAGCVVLLVFSVVAASTAGSPLSRESMSSA